MDFERQQRAAVKGVFWYNRQQRAAVDGDARAGHIAARVRGEKNEDVCDLLRRCKPLERDALLYLVDRIVRLPDIGVSGRERQHADFMRASSIAALRQKVSTAALLGA